MKTRLILTLFFICYFNQSYSQNIVINGSFEDTTLAGWRYRDCGMYPHQDAPFNGGSSCVRVPNSGYWLCPRNYAYQIFPNIQNGDIYRLTAWTKQFFYHEEGGGYITLSRKIPDPPPYDYIFTIAIDTTTSTQWTFLSVQDTFFLEPGDTAAITLRPYYILADFPVENISQLFDLVTLTKIGTNDVKLITNDLLLNVYQSPEGISIHSETSISKISLTNMQGTIYHKAIINKNTYYINTLGLSQGIYILTTTDIYNRTNVKKITVL